MVWILLRRAARVQVEFAVENRLQFERLLADLSAGLIHIAPSDIDSALERGLRQVGAFLRADRGTLDEYSEGAPGIRLSWTAPGVEPVPPVLANVHKFPWTVEALRRGEVVRFSRVDELPSGAAIDRASYLAVGTRSHVSLPLRASGPMLGALSFDSVRDECPWLDDLVERLRLLSEVFAGALERQRMDTLLTQRLRFEELLASLSVALSKVSATEVDRFDQEVERSLRKVADFLEVDRGGLIEFPRGSGGPARSWAIEERLDVDEFPWTTARLKRGDAVGFSQLEELPAEAAVDRQSYLTLRVKSQVAVPLPVGPLVVGGLVFSTVGAERTWPTEVMEQLHLLREVFANTLARRQAELEAQRLRQDLAHIGRVSAMGELTASLAHELNQPLTAILNNAQAAQLLLAAKVVNLETIGRILDDIVADDKRAADVIQGLRALLKRGDPEHASLDLNDVISEVARLVTSDAIVRGVPIRLELAADLPRVRGDRIQLQQVVLNLVLNGLEAMPESAAGDRTLLIRTDPGRRWGRPGRGPGRRERVRREGHGPHVPAALHDQSPGTGDGPGDRPHHRRGTRRPAERRQQRARRGDVPFHGARGPGEHRMTGVAPMIFVVDDDPSVRTSLARLLEAAGYTVETFASAREFLARAPHAGPCCLVLDVRMPGLTGLELQEALAATGRQMSIVFISGHSDVPMSVRAMKAGAIDFLAKPFDVEELLTAIQRCVAKAVQDLAEEARVTEIRQRVGMLTQRETEVFALVVTGMLNKQIAAALGVGEKMVKVHRARVMAKMRAGSVAELVRLADRVGVIVPKPQPPRHGPWSTRPPDGPRVDSPHHDAL